MKQSNKQMMSECKLLKAVLLPSQPRYKSVLYGQTLLGEPKSNGGFIACSRPNACVIGSLQLIRFSCSFFKFNQPQFSLFPLPEKCVVLWLYCSSFMSVRTPYFIVSGKKILLFNVENWPIFSTSIEASWDILMGNSIVAKKLPSPVRLSWKMGAPFLMNKNCFA